MKSALQGSSCTLQRRKALLAPAARKVWQLRVEVRAVQMSARRVRQSVGLRACHGRKRRFTCIAKESGCHHLAVWTRQWVGSALASVWS